MTEPPRQPISFEDYVRLEERPSLQEVMLVAHDEHRVDVWRRVDQRWTQVSSGADERVTLTSIGCELAVGDLYFDPLA